MGESLGIGEIVDGHEIEVGNPGVLRRAHHLSSNPSKSVDAYPYCHSVCSPRLKPIATRVGTAESHVRNYSSTCVVKHLRTAIQRRRRRHHIVDDQDVRADQILRVAKNAKRTRNIRPPFLWCQPSL